LDMNRPPIFTVDNPTAPFKCHDGSQHPKLGEAINVDAPLTLSPTPPLS